MSQRHYIDREDGRVCYLDFGGEGAPVVLLHDLLGRAGTWAGTAEWLIPGFHVVAPDLRGHGWSGRPTGADRLGQLVGDLAAVIEALADGPAVVVGNGLGGLVGWTLAAERPELVRGIVIADHGIDTYSATPELYRGWFQQWPLPFGTLGEVDAYFTAAKWPLRTPFFREAFRESEDGYRPFFEFEDVLAAMAGWTDPRHAAALTRVGCPALVVRGAAGMLPQEELERMAKLLPHGRYAEVPGAGHLPQFDQPDAWRAVVEPFVAEVAEVAPTGTTVE